MPLTILHADLDAFYASVEQLLDPSLRGLPIAVGGGVVLAASYEAKRFGVSSGMPAARARQLCPGLRVVGGHVREYQRLADLVMAVFDEFTPHVQRISIDEAFLDVSGSIHLFGDGATIGTEIRSRVRSRVGLPISVGVASTKHLAKVASQVAKPDGLVVVPHGHERAFLEPLPVGLLWGVGPVTEAKLAGRGIHTIGQMAAADHGMLRSLLGEAVGTKMADLAVNRDHRSVRPGGRSSSVGAQSGFERSTATAQLIRAVLGHLADRVSSRLRASERAGRTVTVRVRFARAGRASRSVTRSHTLDDAVSTTLTITEIAERLVGVALADHPDETEISLLAISVSNLRPQPALQLELPVVCDDPLRPGSPVGAARWAVDRSIDAVRLKFGRTAVGYAGVALSPYHSVPDEFRELAEH
ncbi:MAG: DNA polymerase IV [Ilumatobacteraceae bacterium]